MLTRGGDGRTVFAFMAAVEADPDRPGGGPRGGGRSPILSQGDAGQMLAHLFADLGAMLPEVRKCRLAGAGALYDQCQLLRPAWPVFSALSNLLAKAPIDGASSSLIAVGAGEGGLADRALEPDPGLMPALLNIVPLVLDGPEDVMQALSSEMEHRFLSEGQLSAHTASWLEAAFSTAIAHARFMTLTDLMAMLRLQLEHFGYLPLWELIDAALSRREQSFDATTGIGARYRWQNGAVTALFEPFDYWANRGAGKSVGNDGDGLAAAYVEWHAELRRYGSTLAAHHVPVIFELPDGAEGEIHDRFLVERAKGGDQEGAFASITEHGAPELGVIAITARTEGMLSHFYPLAPSGLNDIHEVLQSMDLVGEGMSFPGSIKIDPQTRKLRAARF